MSQVDSDKKTTSGERETKHLTMCFELHKVAGYFDRHYRSSFDFYLRSVVIRVFFKSLSLLFITKIPKIS